MKKLTFVIPIYNIKQEYLKQCLDSVVKAANYSNDFEALVIDNASTDLTIYPWVQQNYSMFSFLKIIRLETNNGKTSAINESFKHLNSKYYQVIDADDWIESHKVPEIIEKITKINADFYLLNYRYFDQKKDKYKLRRLKRTNKENMSFSHMPKMIWHFECNAIRKVSLIKQHKLSVPNEIKLYQDVYVNAWYLDNAKSVVYLNDWFYNYRINQNGTNLSSSTKLIQNNQDFLNVVNALLVNLKLENKITKSHVKYYLNLQMISYFFWRNVKDKKVFLWKEYKSFLAYVKMVNPKIYDKLGLFSFYKFTFLWGVNPLIPLAGKIVLAVRK